VTAQGKTAQQSKAQQPSAALAREAASSDQSVLTLRQFYCALTVLSAQCFSGIANAAKAWLLMLEKHVQPLADAQASRF